MSAAVQQIILSLRFSLEGKDQLGAQVLKHLDGPESIGPVLQALALLCEGWPDAEVVFRRMVVEHQDRWLADLEAMQPVERLTAALTTMQALGGPPDDLLAKLCRLSALATRELEQQRLNHLSRSQL